MTSSRVAYTGGKKPTSSRPCSTSEKIRKAKRASDDTRSSGKNIKARKTESMVSGHLHDDPNQDVWSELADEQLSYFSKNVASITLSIGETNLFSCSGIAIDCQGNRLTRFLTSASLVKAVNGITIKSHIDLKIKVRHEEAEVHRGFLAEYDLEHNFAIVNVYTFLHVQCGLQHVQKIPPHDDVLLRAFGRDIYGRLIARTVKLSGNLRVSEDNKDLDSKVTGDWEGGPLFSFDGNFAGMNIYFTATRAFFLPWDTIFEHLKRHTSLAQLKFLKVHSFGAGPIGEKSNRHLQGLNQEQLDLDSLGYPKLPSTTSKACMVLVNTFEETFGDIFCEGVWSKLSKKASSNINRSVVALASFNGEKRFFACTGFFIEWNGSTVILTSASLVRNPCENKIVDNLQIKVAIPYDRLKFREGTLQHFCLQLNVAVVSVMDYKARRPANGVLARWNTSNVAAIGRCFESGALMAATGRLTPWTGTLDCKFLLRSSCKITKAGIGGPLVNLDGDVIGMNFYDIKIGTPFLTWAIICNVLESFEGKSKAGDSSGVPFGKMAGADKDRPNRWPVPMPCWRHRDDVDEDKSDDDDDGFGYSYVEGVKVDQY